MKYNFILLFTASIICYNADAQEMLGFRTDNYNGVNGAFFNPANLGNSHFKVDVNVLGINAFVGNSNIKLNYQTLSDLGEDNGLNKIIGTKPNNIISNLAIHLPSVSYSLNEKTTVAFVARTRLLFDVREFDGKLLNSISNDVSGLPITIANSTNMRMNMNMFSEFGVSGGHVVYNNGNHFIKVGATLKYLAGVGNYYFQLNKLTTTLDTNGSGDAVAKNSSGSIAMGGGGLDISQNSNEISFEMKAAGFGADLGAVYEYRTAELSDDRNKYLFKFSVALLDIGSIKYKSIPDYTFGYDIHIAAGQQFEMNKLEGNSGADLARVFDSNPQYFTKTAGLNGGSYKVALPHTLQLSGDVRAAKNIYVAANMQLAMNNSESKPYNPKSITSIVVTPRYETANFAGYLPISYNNLSKVNMGFGLRAGPLYIGSSSIVSRAFGNSKQLDFYFGLRVGFKTKNASKNKINTAEKV